MELYAWQKEAIKTFLEKKQLIVTGATGSGKTLVALEIIKLLREEDPNYNFLIVVPKVVLIETLWLPKLNEYGFTINNVGVYYGLAHEFSKITITTMASVSKLSLDIFDVLILDECHNMFTPRLIGVAKHNFKYKLGLSASIKGKDQRYWQLLESLNYNLFEYDIATAIKDKVINKFNFVNVGVNIVEQDIRDKYELIESQIKVLLAQSGGFDNMHKDSVVKKQLQSLFNQRNELIMNYHRKIDIVANIIEKHKGKQVLCYNQYNVVATKLFWALVGKSIKSEIINTAMDKKIADAAIKSFNIGKLHVLLTTRQLDEGADIRMASICILMASNSGIRQFIQRIGRVLRKKSEPSTIYQVYVINTFEEKYAKDKIEYIKGLCESFTEEEY